MGVNGRAVLFPTCIFAIVVQLSSCAFADEYPPTSGSLVGSRDGDLLDFDCLPIDSTKITCDFVQVLLSNRSNNEKLEEGLNTIPQFLDELKAEDDICKVFIARKAILVGDLVEDAEVAAEAQRVIDEENRAVRESPPETVARNGRLLSAFDKLCEQRNAEAAKELIMLTHELGAETCEAVFNRYTQVFVRVDESLWVVESSPSSGCGIVDTSRLYADPKYPYLWNYEASKVVTNKSGTDIVPCSGLDERPQAYAWNQPPVYKNCKFLE